MNLGMAYRSHWRITASSSSPSPGHRSRQYRHHRRLWPRQDESSAALRIAVVSERHAHGAIHLQDTERLPYRQENHDARHTRDTYVSEGHGRLAWFVDDADDLLDPFRTDDAANDLRMALADPDVTVICAVEKPNAILADRCPTRIVFPAGDRTNDLMNGIPGPILDGFEPDDYMIAGRAVFIRQASACLVQCVERKDFAGPSDSF